MDLDTVLGTELFSKHVKRYDAWLEKGYSGQMGYLARGRDRRADPRLVFPEAQSIFCVAVPYPKTPGGAKDHTLGPRYARYLHGKDYHTEIANRLEGVMKALTEELRKEPGTDLQFKICVDTSAVLERTWAALSGLGWIGKNTLLIHPQYGSYLFLASVLLNRKLDHGPTLLPNYCGNCTRCLQSCPTQAFPDAGVLDANRCISYLTLEKRGDLETTPDTQSKMGSWIAGCDICQEVCPFNTKPARQTEVLVNRGALEKSDWLTLINETPEQYKFRVRDSSLSRVKPRDFSRNLAIALQNALEQMEPADRSQLSLALGESIRNRIQCEADALSRAQWMAVLTYF